MKELLAGKTALVTGGSRGIGASTCRDLAANGAHVAINYLQAADKAAEVQQDITASGGKAIIIQADVRNRESVDEMVATVEKDLGPVDILVNNANIHFPMKPFIQLEWPEIEAKLTGEIGAMVHCCQRVLPHMIKRKAGKIILVSSSLSREPGYGFSAHCGAKAAVDSMARAMALELGPDNIQVNVVGPGLTRTDATAFLPPEIHKQTAAHTPLKRVGEPEDVSRVILFLASHLSDFLTGQYVPVNGGGFML